MDTKKLASLMSSFKRVAQEMTRTDPVMDLVDKYKDKLLQVAADASAGKSVRSADVYLNFDGASTMFIVEATGPDAQAYSTEATNSLNKTFKLLLNQATQLLKKEKSGPIKMRILADLEFQVR